MGIMKAQSSCLGRNPHRKVEQKLSKETEKLKFDDAVIRDFISDFSYLNKEGKVKRKKRSFTPINVPKKSRLKGLKLYQGRDKHNQISKNKYFYVQYKLKGFKSPRYYPLGKFVFGRYGVKEVGDELTELNKIHTDNKGHWISCPLEARQKAKIIITKEEAVERKKQPTSKVIEDYWIVGPSR